MADNALVEIIRDYLAQVAAAGIPSPSGVLFGSYAREDANADSDIDLLVVSPTFDGAKKRELVDTLWRITWRADSRIEPIPVGSREFDADDVSPLIAAARREGIVIEMDPARKAGARLPEWRTPKPSAAVVAEKGVEYAPKDDDKGKA
jgi:predicted nucleotidyltransferase